MDIKKALEIVKQHNAWRKKANPLSYHSENVTEAIDTVIAEVEKPLQSDEQIEQYAIENILDGVGIQSMINTKAWIAGATWMRDLIQERSKK